MSDLAIPVPLERVEVTVFIRWQTTMAQLHPLLVRYDAQIVNAPVMGADIGPLNSPKGMPVRVSFTTDGWTRFQRGDLTTFRCMSR